MTATGTTTASFATVGLYTNVPEGGEVGPEQQDWLGEEMKAAEPDMPLILAMHHPIHSLDIYHSGSKAMAKLLSAGVAASGRIRAATGCTTACAMIGASGSSSSNGRRGTVASCGRI